MGAPTRTPRVGLLGVEGLAISPDSAFVAQRDIYEPNDIAPADLGALPSGMFNPSLAFEARGRLDSIARTDWYRFDNTGTLDRTIFLSSSSTNRESYQVFISDSLAFDGVQGQFQLAPVSWTVGSDLQTCGGFPFAPEVLATDSVVVALRGLAAGSYHVLAAYDKPGAYQFAILPEYRSALPPGRCRGK